MTLLRDLIEIPTSVGEADFVVRASGEADLDRYVVTDDLRRNFTEALDMIGHAVTSGRSQAAFLHGSFGSGKSHFLAVLREILQHNPGARGLPNLVEPVVAADEWLAGTDVLVLSFHMLDAESVEQAVLEGYYRQVTAAHPDQPPPAVHRSDALLDDAANLRASLGDEAFFARLNAGPGVERGPTSGRSPAPGDGLAAHHVRAAGWTAETYAQAAASPPGTKPRDDLVGALTATFFSGAVRSGEYLDLDTGLQVVTRHAQQVLGYRALVFFLDEFILWLSTRIADQTFVQTEGAKLNKLVESADTARPIPLVSFVARQRNLEDFLGPRVGGTERAALADLMRSVQGRLGNIVLADTNLPEIVEKRLLKPVDDRAQAVIDQAFTAVRGNRQVWDILLLGAQYGDAGIGSDASAFRKLYPFSPALVATLVALSQALQRERTALRVLTELLAERRDALEVNDLIPVAALFEPLVLRGELPDEPKLRQQFQAARETYRRKLRPLLRSFHGVTEDDAAAHSAFQLDDQLVRTLLLGALVPEVPALQQLTAAKLHALNFGSIAAPIPGYENQIVLDRLRRLHRDAGELHLSDDADPVVSIELSRVDYDRLLELVPHQETSAGVRQRIVRDLLCQELGLRGEADLRGEMPYTREWRGRRHTAYVRFGTVSDPDGMPTSSLLATGEEWVVVVDYPFDESGRGRSAALARVRDLAASEQGRASRTVFWLPRQLSDEVMSRINQLAKVNYLLGAGGTGERLQTLAADWSLADRQQGKLYLQQRQGALRQSVVEALKQAYGVVRPQASDVDTDSMADLRPLTEGLGLGAPRGGTIGAAFDQLTGELLQWAYPGTPALPEDAKPPTRQELAHVLHHAQRAAADRTRGVAVEEAHQRTLTRLCHPLRLGELNDHRYVLTMDTCWWSGHLSQEAAREGYTDRFPVRLLRTLLDRPEARGFDRDLQNLIIAVFALEQQLAWYRHGTKVPVEELRAVDDELELRQPPMPGEEAWREAARRGHDLFGERLPEWCSPVNLAEMAGTLRRAAARHRQSVGGLVSALTEHADDLGLDPDATTGRLATARRASALLATVADERDDVALVEQVAAAALGPAEDKAVGQAIKSAQQVTTALDNAQWGVLRAVRSRADESARAQVATLQDAARYEQHAADLAAAVEEAVTKGAALLAGDKPPPPDPVDPPDSDDPPAASGERTVDGAAEWEAVAGEIRHAVAAGHRLQITWSPAP